MSRPTYIYHERQLGALCGVHCVNNLLQGPRFGPGDLAEIGVRLDKKERRLLSKSRLGSAAGSRGPSPSLEAETCSSPNFDGSADGGNFSIQVLSIALARAGLKLLPAEHPDGRELMVGERARGTGAFVVQRRDHWYTLRTVGPCWWDLDSTLQRPKPLDNTGLSGRLRRLASGGHSIFIVTGALPAQMLTGADGTAGALPGDSFWHDASTLLNTRVHGGTGGVCGDAGVSANPSTSSGSFDEVAAGTLEAGSLEGFSDAEVQAALFLADHNRHRAAEVLWKARKSIEGLLDVTPQRLAQALSAAVSAVLQARRSLPGAIARLVALLCAPSADHLAAAASVVDCGDLAHRLLTALAKKARGWLWTEGLMQAAAAARAADVASFEAPASGSDGEPAPLEPGTPLERPRRRDGPSHTDPQVGPSRATVEVAKCGDDVDFSTIGLDALLDSVPCEGYSPGQPVISALGLKSMDCAAASDSARSCPKAPLSPSIAIASSTRSRPCIAGASSAISAESTQGRCRARRRPSSHSARLLA